MGRFEVYDYSTEAISFLIHLLVMNFFAIRETVPVVAWAYLLGFLVPLPFWIAYKLWPKLRTDYLYTPLIWYAPESLFVVHF